MAVKPYEGDRNPDYLPTDHCPRTANDLRKSAQKPIVIASVPDDVNCNLSALEAWYALLQAARTVSDLGVDPRGNIVRYRSSDELARLVDEAREDYNFKRSLYAEWVSGETLSRWDADTANNYAVIEGLPLIEFED